MANNSAITFWSREANDNSAGQTSETSGNRHPSGYATGQRWYVTASQWNTEFRTQFTNAHDGIGVHPSGPPAIAGLTTPTGWVSGQLYSASSQQWHDMWATEWANARDQQGLAYSYPGQSAYVMLWSQSASYWRGQADQLWGSTRLWGSGETWEAAYNRVNPASLWTYDGPMNRWTSAASTIIDQVQVPYTGYYTCVVRGIIDAAGNETQCTFSLQVGGAVADTDTSDASGSATMHASIGLFWRGFLAAGSFVQHLATVDASLGGNYRSALHVTFSPTPQYPH